MHHVRVKLKKKHFNLLIKFLNISFLRFQIYNTTYKYSNSLVELTENVMTKTTKDQKTYTSLQLDTSNYSTETYVSRDRQCIGQIVSKFSMGSL